MTEPKPPKRRKNEPELYFAARIVMYEYDNLVNSTSPGTLHELAQIAADLEAIEDRL